MTYETTEYDMDAIGGATAEGTEDDEDAETQEAANSDDE